MIQPWLLRDRERFGFTAAQVAGHLGVTRQEYLELEGHPLADLVRQGAHGRAARLARLRTAR